MTKRRRFGNIRRTSAGRWQVRYPGPGGVPRKGPHTFATKTDADRFLTKVEHELNTGTWRDPSISSVTLSTYSETWLEHRTLAPRTRDLYADLLRMHVLPDLGPFPLGQITPGEVSRWHAATAKRLKSEGAKRGGDGRTRLRQAYSLLRAIMTTAVNDDLIASNPCRIPRAGQVKTPERDLLSMDQVLALIDAADEWFRPVVTLTFWAHLRLGEVLAVCREDVDLDTGTLRVHRQIVRTTNGFTETEPKAASRRVVHLPRQAVESLRNHLASTPGRPADRLFTRPDGRPLLHHHVQTAWQRTRNRAELPSAYFHDLRHAGLTMAAQAGATPREIMARGGHSTARAAMIYQHAPQERDAVIAEMLSAYADSRQGS